MSIGQLKRQFLAALLSVCVAGIALGSSTYAWYVSNNKVEGTTSKIYATTNGFILQIASVEDGGAQHGGNEQSLSATNFGGKITPSSTNDIKDWFVCEGWDTHGNVLTYTKPSFKTGTDARAGEYSAGGEDHFAYIKSEFILYTMTQTGYADVFLDSTEGSPITVSIDNGKTASSTTIPDSMRIAITTQELEEDGITPKGTEELRVVYAPKQETGKGNDSTGKNGMTAIVADGTGGKLVDVTYPYIYATKYVDQNSKNWAVVKTTDGSYIYPTGQTEETSEAIAKGIGYNGIMARIYIWMEGTDADCVNNSAVEDEATYSVVVKFAGVTP